MTLLKIQKPSKLLVQIRRFKHHCIKSLFKEKMMVFFYFRKHKKGPLDLFSFQEYVQSVVTEYVLSLNHLSWMRTIKKFWNNSFISEQERGILSLWTSFYPPENSSQSNSISYCGLARWVFCITFFFISLGTQNGKHVIELFWKPCIRGVWIDLPWTYGDRASQKSRLKSFTLFISTM